MAYLIIILMTLLFTVGTMWASHFAIQGRFQPLFRRMADHIGLEIESCKHDRICGYLPPAAHERQLLAHGDESSAVPQTTDKKSAWLMFNGSLGIEETIVGLHGPDIPPGLVISPDPPSHKSAITWFPYSADPQPTDWSPYRWRKNTQRTCLGQLPNGYYVEGTEKEILPLMSAQTRKLLGSLGEHESYELKDGTITATLPGAVTDESYLTLLFGRLSEIADALSLDQAQRIAQLVRMSKTEKHPCLRAFCLERLYHYAPDSRAAQELDEWVLGQPDPRLRLLAWIRQGEAGIARFRQLFADPAPHAQGQASHVTETLRCIALRVLLQYLPAPEINEIVEDVIAGPNPHLWIILLWWAAHNEDTGLLPRLSQELSRRPQLLRPRTIPPLLRLVSRLEEKNAFADLGVESHCVQMLEACDDPEVAALLLPGLASWGSANALTPLYRSKKVYPSLAAQIDGCCEQIRSRIGPVEAGGLSLSEPSGGGQISLAPEKSGAVSIA